MTEVSSKECFDFGARGVEVEVSVSLLSSDGFRYLKMRTALKLNRTNGNLCRHRFGCGRLNHRLADRPAQHEVNEAPVADRLAQMLQKL